MKLLPESFTNSAACHGASFTAKDAPLDIATIEISGRYPESGWARNCESHEMVYVLKGEGRLLRKDNEAVQLTEGDVVHVPAKEWFAWNGSMTILMACSPAFDPTNYEVTQ